MQNVLVTGMSGLIGSAVGRTLEGRYQLSALNRRDVPGIPTTRADIADIDGIRNAFEGIDAVVHLASAFERDGFEGMLASNVRGTHNVFECARQARVRRVVYASSSGVTANYEQEEPYKAIVEGRYEDVPSSWSRITHADPPRPSGVYGCTKLWGEALARCYADIHNMSILCLRFSYVTESDRPDSPRRYANWTSQRDAGQAVLRCLEAPADLSYAIMYVTSNNKWGYRDIEHTKNLVGYAPEDSADVFR